MAAHLAGVGAAHTTLAGRRRAPLAAGAIDGVDVAVLDGPDAPGHPRRHRRRRRVEGTPAILVVEMLAITDADLQAKLDVRATGAR